MGPKLYHIPSHPTHYQSSLVQTSKLFRAFNNLAVGWLTVEDLIPIKKINNFLDKANKATTLYSNQCSHVLCFTCSIYESFLIFLMYFLYFTYLHCCKTCSRDMDMRSTPLAPSPGLQVFDIIPPCSNSSKDWKRAIGETLERCWQSGLERLIGLKKQLDWIWLW